MLARTMSVTIIGVVALGAALAPRNSVAATPAASTIHKCDTDKDKTLDLAEVKAAASAHFDRLDKDADGTLDAKKSRILLGRQRSNPPIRTMTERFPKMNTWRWWKNCSFGPTPTTMGHSAPRS
jgi:hypothetical protein